MSEDWQLREYAKFEDGTYTHVPWVGYTFQNHFPNEGRHELRKNSKGERPFYRFTHVSTESPSMVAYTVDHDKGKKDKQVKTKVGKYLKKFYPDMDERVYRDWIAYYNEKWGTPVDVKFAFTPEEIEHVYQKGPESCMRRDSFSSKIHPCRVYGAGDLAVAYMERKGKITSRTLCWPEKKIFSTVYGDKERMLPALKQLAFKKGEMEGARLLQIEHKTNSESRKIYVAPYIDDSQHYITVGEKFNYVGKQEKKTKFAATNTNGLGHHINHCAVCYEELSRRAYELSGETYCKTHFDEIAYQCSHCGGNRLITTDHMLLSSSTWCYPCYLDNHFTCDFCETPKRMHRRGGITKDKKVACTRCLELKSNNIKRCRRCGTVHNIDEKCECYSAGNTITGNTHTFSISSTDAVWHSFTTT